MTWLDLQIHISMMSREQKNQNIAVTIFDCIGDTDMSVLGEEIEIRQDDDGNTYLWSERTNLSALE